MSQSDFRRVEADALRAENAIQTRKGQDATLGATIRAIELYMQALKLADNAPDRKRVDAKCKALLAQAEAMKMSRDAVQARRMKVPPAHASSAPGTTQLRQPVSSRKLTTKEQIILLEGSKLNGFMFKPWVAPPGPEMFQFENQLNSSPEEPELEFSEEQKRCFDGWRPPAEALGRLRLPLNGAPLSNRPTMTQEGKLDLVQDMTSDCSVVASLCTAAARVARGHPKVSRNCEYQGHQ